MCQGFLKIGDIDCLWDRGSIDIDRKVYSMYAKLFKDSSILYKMLDGRDYSDIIWDSIPPASLVCTSIQPRAGHVYDICFPTTSHQ